MTVFIPGETISHKFVVPFQSGSVTKIIVTYRQDNHVILEKIVYPGQVESLPAGNGQFTVLLSQEESLLFDDDKLFYVQINAILTNNTRCTSAEIKGTNLKQHIREVVS